MGHIGVFIPIIGIIGLVIMIIYLRKYENEERMAMIDKGIDPSIFTKKVYPQRIAGGSGCIQPAATGVGRWCGKPEKDPPAKR